VSFSTSRVHPQSLFSNRFPLSMDTLLVDCKQCY
jgi:hypothetical protein